MEREAEAELPLTLQAELLSVSRANLYYHPRPARTQEIALKHRLDVLYTEHPFLGSRKIAQMLAGEGFTIGRHTIRRYRQEMGLETLFPKPKLSVLGRGSEHRVFPYLLRGLSIERPNQVWGVDITDIRLTQGWMYLIAFWDWYSRYVVAWELSDSWEIDFVIACASVALERAVPEILNSDQGSHFTSPRFTERFLVEDARISMDTLTLA